MRRWVRVLVIVVGALLGGAARSAWAQDTQWTAADLFDDSQLHTINLTIHPLDWEELRENFLLNTYYASTFEWRGHTLENIGIRSRGTGSRSNGKPGLRVDFNRFAESQEFLGLKSLILRNNIQDASGLNERIAMKLFARLGLPAPREAHARLYVNGEYAGLYTIVEAVDKTFLAAHFGQDDGYLYEYDYDVDDQPYRFEFRGSDPALYSPKPFKPVTHERDPEPGPLAAMIRAITETPKPGFAAVLSQHLDLERFVMQAAIESFVGETDGVLGRRGMNNFYLYRFSGTSLSTVIPWDKSEAFKGRVDDSIWRDVDDVPSWLQNLLMTRLMLVPELRAVYLDTLLRCADAASEPVATVTDEGEPGPAIGWLESEVRGAYAQIRDAAIEDPWTPFPDWEFELGINALIDFARERSDYVRRGVERSPR